MNNEQQELLNEVYRHYLMEDAKILPNMSKEKMTELGYGLSQEEFINKCKTDTEFSKKWGLKIEKRELSRKERSDYYYKHGNSEGIVEGSLDRPIWKEDNVAHKWYDDKNIPTKLITITYNDKTIESYE
jgi:hypothetical protein